MLLITVPFIIGWTLLIVATNVEMLIVGRAFIGIGAGGVCVSGPVCSLIAFTRYQIAQQHF